MLLREIVSNFQRLHFKSIVVVFGNNVPHPSSTWPTSTYQHFIANNTTSYTPASTLHIWWSYMCYCKWTCILKFICELRFLFFNYIRQVYHGTSSLILSLVVWNTMTNGAGTKTIRTIIHIPFVPANQQLDYHRQQLAGRETVRTRVLSELGSRIREDQASSNTDQSEKSPDWRIDCISDRSKIHGR